jgi:hypothetical protein
MIYKYAKQKLEENRTSKSEKREIELRKYIKPGMKLTNKIHAEACHIYYT